MPDKKIVEAAELIAESRLVVALTGAGISVDSGIPDFRSPGGLWERFDPMDYAHIDSFNRDPARVWQMLDAMHGTVADAEANSGHLALARLEKLGRLHAIITQNIDNLHQKSGSGTVIEFHGNSHRLLCLSCDKRYTHDEIDYSPGTPPRCECGEILKPDVIFFGEAIPPAAYRQAMILAQQADVMLVAGTSAQVAPANMLPQFTLSAGGRLIEVNLEKTHLSRYHDAMFLQGGTSEILPLLAEEIAGILGS